MKNRGSGAFGAPSLILIAVVLCMTVFAALALQSARADRRATDKTCAAAAAYAAADARAERLLADVDAALTAGTGLPDGVTGDVGGELTYTVEIDKTRSLSVTLDTSGARYRIVAWVVEPAGEWVADSELDLY